MNTYDIELPAEFRSGNAIPVTIATIKRERMEEILRAAIEADRKRKGEVVVTKTFDGGIIAVTRQDDEGRILSVIAESDRKLRFEPVAWLYEDELPDNYPYDTMFPYSKVDGVRMFPVYVPQPTEQVIPSEITADKLSDEQSAWHSGWEASRDALPRITDADIQRIMLNHGYTVRPYIYAAVRELIAFAQGRNL